MVLAKKIVLVEGPSDEIIFERIFRDIYNRRPMELGIDVVSMRGLSLARCLELCAALGKTVAALRARLVESSFGDTPHRLVAAVETHEGERYVR